MGKKRSFKRKSLFLAFALLGGILTTAVKAEAVEILYALYGDLNANNADNRRIDATAKIKSYVGSQTSVSLSPQVMHTLFTGVGIDPAPGVNKGLAVVYRNAGNIRLHFSYYYDTTTMPDNTDYDLGPVNTSSNLQILAAVYGDLNKSGAVSKSDFAQSITIANTNLLQNNVMNIPPYPSGTQKHQFFGDPIFGVHKGFLAVVSSGGQLFMGCYGHTEGGQLSNNSFQFSATPNAASPPPAPAPPTVASVFTDSWPTPPSGLKLACFTGPRSPQPDQMTNYCPMIMYNGIEFRAFSYTDNRYSIGLVGYDKFGNIVSPVQEFTGTRYVWEIALDTVNQTAIIKGQSSPDGTIKTSVTVPWSKLK